MLHFWDAGMAAERDFAAVAQEDAVWREEETQKGFSSTADEEVI